ncbi:hypothetical protein ACHAXS_013371 [Conticribra weissflogii]
MPSVEHDNTMDWPQHGSEQPATVGISDGGDGSGASTNLGATEAHIKSNAVVEASSEKRLNFPDHQIMQLQQCPGFPVECDPQNQIPYPDTKNVSHHYHVIQALQQQEIDEQNNTQTQQNHPHQQNFSDPSNMDRKHQQPVEQWGVYQQQSFPEIERLPHLQHALQHENINNYNNESKFAESAVHHKTTQDLGVLNNRNSNSESISTNKRDDTVGKNSILCNYVGQPERVMQFQQQRNVQEHKVQMMKSAETDNIGMDTALAAQAVEAAAPMYNGVYNNYPDEGNLFAENQQIPETQKLHRQQQKQQNHQHHQLNEPNSCQQKPQIEGNKATNQQADNNNCMINQVQNPNTPLADHTVTVTALHSQHNHQIWYLPQTTIAPQYQHHFSHQRQPYVQQQHSQQRLEQYSQQHQNLPMQNLLLNNYPPSCEGNSNAASTEVVAETAVPANTNDTANTNDISHEKQQHCDHDFTAVLGDGQHIPTNHAQNNDSNAPKTIDIHLQNSTYEAANARKIMDELLNEQSKCSSEILLAEQELLRAQQRLEAAMRNKDHMDAKVNEVAEQLTDSLLKEHTRWNAQYKKLKKYKEATGHCDLKRNPTRSSKGRKYLAKNLGIDDHSTLSSLGSWIGQVRLEARRPPGHPDRLEAYKIIALNRLGFDWQPRENYWMDMYEQLKVYLKENDGKMPPRTVNNKKFPLGVWCDTQLDNYRKFCSGRKGAYITQEKIDMLNSIG